MAKANTYLSVGLGAGVDFLIFSYLRASLVSVPFNSNLCCGRVECVGRTSLTRVKSVSKKCRRDQSDHGKNLFRTRCKSAQHGLTFTGAISSSHLPDGWRKERIEPFLPSMCLVMLLKLLYEDVFSHA